MCEHVRVYIMHTIHGSCWSYECVYLCCETPRVIFQPSILSALQALRQYLVWDSDSIEECQDMVLEQMFESVDQDTSDEESSDDKKKRKGKSKKAKGRGSSDKSSGDGQKSSSSSNKVSYWLKLTSGLNLARIVWMKFWIYECCSYTQKQNYMYSAYGEMVPEHMVGCCCFFLRVLPISYVAYFLHK